MELDRDRMAAVDKDSKAVGKVTRIGKGANHSRRAKEKVGGNRVGGRVRMEWKMTRGLIKL